MIKYLDNIVEKVAFKIAKTLYKAKIKPMSVTVFRFIIAAPASWYLFSRGEYIYNVIGLFVYMALAVLDTVDGAMAQLYKLHKQTAPFGKLMDRTSDLILMLIVLGAIMYAGMNGPNSNLWILVTVTYYSIFLFITALMFEFDKTFSLDIHGYPELERKMRQINNPPSITDRVLYNVLYVHNNSFTRIFFTHNLLLFAGIVTNQLLPVFIYFVFMHFTRSVGVFLIKYQTLHMRPTKSALAKVLRQYIRPQ